MRLNKNKSYINEKVDVFEYEPKLLLPFGKSIIDKFLIIIGLIKFEDNYFKYIFN